MVLSGRQTDQHHLVTGRTVQRPGRHREHTQSDGSAPPGHRPDRTAACHIQNTHSQTDQHHLVTGRTVQRPASYRTHTVRRISTTWSPAGPYSGLPHTEHTQSDGSAPPGHWPDRTAACHIQNTHSQTDQHHLVTGRTVQRPGRHGEYTQSDGSAPPGHRPDRTAACHIQNTHSQTDQHHLVTGRTVQRPATYRTHTVRRISTTWSPAGPYSGLADTDNTHRRSVMGKEEQSAAYTRCT